jgi:O-antigen biosynthesis protein
MHENKTPAVLDRTNTPERSPALSNLLSEHLSPLFWRPQRQAINAGAWWTHVPFAFWLTSAATPRQIVELGTHEGVSYSAFCEAVVRTGLETRCYAIDTWAGDAHAGDYDRTVYDDLRAFNELHYANFSELIRSNFDEAVAHFEDGVIDILHIDGLHTYDAVRHDFETWKPKLSERGIVLFHDTNVKQGDFGVWRFWAEISKLYPHFEFLHGHGLAILAVGSNAPPMVLELCRLTEPNDISTLRDRFAFIGTRWLDEWRKGAEIKWLSAQLADLSTRVTQSEADCAKRARAILDFEQSTSWRITRPLRKIRGAFSGTRTGMNK